MVGAMRQENSVTETFLKTITVRLSDECTNDELTMYLQEACRRGQEAWPELKCSSVGFAKFLGSITPNKDVASWLKACSAGDLWLAFACLSGSGSAQMHLDGMLRQIGMKVAAKMRLAPDEMDELCQELFMTLLVEDGLNRYSGSGSLRGWLRVVVTNRALSALRQESPHVALSDAVMENMAIDEKELELAAFKDRCVGEFRAAFRQAIAGLEPKERNLLRYHLVDRVSMKRIASHYNVTNVTVSRWFAALRSKLAKSTHKILAQRLGVPSTEIKNILRMLESKLDSSFSAIWQQSDGIKFGLSNKRSHQRAH